MAPIVTERLIVRLVGAADAVALRDFQWRNRDHLRMWEPLHDDAFSQPEAVSQRLVDMQARMQANQARHFVLCDPADERVLGQCNFTNIMRGPFDACFLGFSLDRQEEGKGLMQEALQATIRQMFDTEKLHRIMANYQPENRRSEKLLQRLGFEREGFARHYLKINGEWKDHILTACINDSLP